MKKVVFPVLALCLLRSPAPTRRAEQNEQTANDQLQRQAHSDSTPELIPRTDGRLTRRPMSPPAPATPKRRLISGRREDIYSPSTRKAAPPFPWLQIWGIPTCVKSMPCRRTPIPGLLQRQ
jgi:hypothetical protein